MNKVLSITVIAVLALSACSAESPDPTPSDSTAPQIDATAQAILDTHDVTETDVVALIDTLDATPVSERAAGLMASVRPGELQLSDLDSGDTTSVPIPDDLFYLSFAPYYDSTHECYFHSLTTCKGELGGETFSVTVTDSDSGEVIVNDDITAFDNGFAGVWLPRDIEATLLIEHDGASVETPIATGPEDATCLTTVQLS